MELVQVKSLEEAAIHITSLSVRLEETERRLRVAEKWIDTFLATPRWKRILFRIDGWSGHRLVDRPSWRPWRRWWRS
jgi:hypothetical protein